jgi:hypothetical protein
MSPKTRQSSVLVTDEHEVGLRDGLSLDRFLPQDAKQLPPCPA